MSQRTPQGENMKILAFNGSPRKKRNTATLLENALQGAASQGAQTEMIHLYDLAYKGCSSCFQCKILGGKSYGKCALKDDLTPLLCKVATVDAVVFGSPIYFGTVTGETSSFLERLLFPYLVYANPPQSLFPGKIRAGFIFSMGIPEELMEEFGTDRHIGIKELALKMIFGNGETLVCNDTYQFDDYTKVRYEFSDPAQKTKRRTEVFPFDCRRAFELGVRLVTPA